MLSTPGTDVKIKAWTPAVLCKIQDNIISSKFANAKVFMPSYESTRSSRPCMEQLLTNEYQRIWWQEKEAWDKKFSRKTVSKSLLQRKVIARQPPTKETATKLSKKGTKIKRKVPEKKPEEPVQQKESKQDNKRKEVKGKEKKKEPEAEAKKKEAKPEVPEADQAKAVAEEAPAKEAPQIVEGATGCGCLECENL